MNRGRGLAALFLVGAIVSGCASQAPGAAAGLGEATSQASRAPGTEVGAAQAATSLNAFGFDYYKAALRSGGNAVVSPTSIVLALAMARAGAAGDTAKQMDTVLHGPVASDFNSLDQALAGISGTFKDRHGDDAVVALRIANATFAQSGEQFKQPFLDTLASQYGAGLRLVDFKSDAAGACKLINNWVSEKTEARIPQILDKLDPLTRLVLANAIYMKAPWRTPFLEESSRSLPFMRLDRSQVSVPTMRGRVSARYARGDVWQAVELPYLGGSLAMTIVVPNDLASFEAGLSGERFGEIEASLQAGEVLLNLPRFKIDGKIELADALAAMGMPLAFDPVKADFSAITTQEPLYISRVVHQANVSVDEKGTEASAATVVAIAVGGVPEPVPVVQVDRPFIFAVRDTKTGAILFLGRVVDPGA